MKFVIIDNVFLAAGEHSSYTLFNELISMK